MFTRLKVIIVVTGMFVPTITLAGHASSASSAHSYVLRTSSSPDLRSPAPTYTFRRYDPYDPSTPSLYRRTPRDTQCRLSNSVLSMLASPDRYDCGGGWTFPGLIQGNCPVYVCMLKVRSNTNSIFGPMD